jgi:hypothetical protein
MMLETSTLTAADTAVVLRAKLGPLRSWPDFLADNIRGQQSVHGYTLLPRGRKKIKGHYRPVYSTEDIDAFVERVIATEPGAGKSPIRPIKLKIDPSKHWKLNRFEEDGSPTIH